MYKRKFYSRRKRFIKRRRLTRAVKRYKRRGTMIGNKAGFPPSIKFRHKYVEKVFLSSTPATNGGQRFSCNSLYDPNSAGVGHQPLLFDQLSALYNHWTVIGSEIKVTFTPVTNPPIQIVMFLNDDTTLATSDLNTLAEQRSGRIRSTILTGTNPITMTMRYSAKKTYGGSVRSNPNLQGDAVSNPPEQLFYEIASNTMDGVNNTSCYAIVELTYIAIWDELKEITSS